MTATFSSDLSERVTDCPFLGTYGRQQPRNARFARRLASTTEANAWIDDFQNFCKASHLPVDFVSTHHYPTDAFGKPGDDTVT